MRRLYFGWIVVSLLAMAIVGCDATDTQSSRPAPGMDADLLDTTRTEDSGVEAQDSRAEAQDTATRDSEAEDTAQLDAPTLKDVTTDVEVSPAPRTEEALDAFFEAYGGRAAFPDTYVNAVETLLYAEDDVVKGDFAAARERIDAIFGAQPLSDPIWWNGVDTNGTNVGTPVAYYGLRMLDTIADVGLGEVAATSEAITMTVVLVGCAEGRRPTVLDLEQGGEEVALALHPDLLADEHRIIHQSLRLFRHYVWAITGGRLTLEVDVVPVEVCVDVDFRADPPYAGIGDFGAPIDALPREVRDGTDMWWVLYPSNVPSDPVFDGVAFITGGMGGYASAPVFLIDDLWLVRKPSHLGDGPYSDVERRVYLPQWLQHEFFHHLFLRYPEFGLEAEGHQWFDRSTWPDDFVGAWEPDYYEEAIRKRFLTAEPPLWHTLRNAAPPDALLQAIPEDAVRGRYSRLPVENDWHVVRIERDAGGLWWRNDAGVEWSVTFGEGVLRWDANSPYGAQDLRVELTRDANGAFTTELVGLRTPDGELYTRVNEP